MFALIRNDIKGINGDSGFITVKPLNGSLVSGDKIRFTVKKEASNDVMISKTITSFVDGAGTIALNPAETQIAADVYRYDIQIDFADGRVHTAKIGRFIVLEGVTD